MKIILKRMTICLQVWIMLLIFAPSNHSCGWNKPLQQAAFFHAQQTKETTHTAPSGDTEMPPRLQHE